MWQIFTDLNVAHNVPDHSTGCVSIEISSSYLLTFYIDSWEAKTNTSVSFYVPDNWTSGRIWVSDLFHECMCNSYHIDQGRRNCNFTSSPGPNSCLVGGCNGGLMCDSHTGTVLISTTHLLPLMTPRNM